MMTPEAPHYVIFSSLLLHPPPLKFNTLSSTLFSDTLRACLLRWKRPKLQMCTF